MHAVKKQNLDHLYPLCDFFNRSGEISPHSTLIHSESIPEPYRSLLVHDDDMTPTLERFIGGRLQLKTLKMLREDESLLRQVLLVPETGGLPLEFGAIRIELTPFDQAAREKIIGCKTPFGTILHDHNVAHQSRPDAYFSIKPDPLIRAALGLEESDGQTLYGRHNVITGADGLRLAEVVEVLPPHLNPPPSKGGVRGG